MKIVPQPDGSFLSVMTAADAAEARLASDLDTIITMAKLIEATPHGPEDRARDRGGNWRYAKVKKSLNNIRVATANALQIIKLIDFPEADKPETEAELQ